MYTLFEHMDPWGSFWFVRFKFNEGRATPARQSTRALYSVFWPIGELLCRLVVGLRNLGYDEKVFTFLDMGPCKSIRYLKK